MLNRKMTAVLVRRFSHGMRPGRGPCGALRECERPAMDKYCVQWRVSLREVGTPDEALKRALAMANQKNEDWSGRRYEVTPCDARGAPLVKCQASTSEIAPSLPWAVSAGAPRMTRVRPPLKDCPKCCILFAHYHWQLLPINKCVPGGAIGSTKAVAQSNLRCQKEIGNDELQPRRVTV